MKPDLMKFIQTILKWDISFYHFINKTLYSPLPFWFFQLITNLVDLVIFFLFGYLVVFRIFKRQASDANKTLLTILVPVFITAIITLFLKIIIPRGAPTPFVTPWLQLQLLPSRYVFPSGHTSRAFAFATALAIEFPRWRIILILIAVLIGFSRIYIGAHYFTDVLGGAVLGSLISWIFVRLRRGR